MSAVWLQVRVANDSVEFEYLLTVLLDTFVATQASSLKFRNLITGKKRIFLLSSRCTGITSRYAGVIILSNITSGGD